MVTVLVSPWYISTSSAKSSKQPGVLNVNKTNIKNAAVFLDALIDVAGRGCIKPARQVTIASCLP